MSLFRNRAPEQRQWTPEPAVPPFPGLDGGGGPSNMSAALRQSAVWACVRLLADTVSMMPLDLYTFSDGVRVRVEPTPNERRLLTQPGGDALMPDFLYMLMVSLLLRGNAFAIKDFADPYTIRAVNLLNPESVNAHVDPTTNALEIRDPQGNVIRQQNVWRMAAYRLPGTKLGLAPIAYHATTISTDAEVQKFALGFFREALHPTSVLTSDQSIKQGDAVSIIERLRAKRDSREPLVLGAGLKFTPLAVTPNESQFLETQKYGVAAIARVFGVPPEMIASESGNSMTYANVEQRSIDFLTYSIQPWLTRIEAAMATWFPGSKHPRFDTSALLRTDLETRMKAGAMAVAAKIHDPDEVRAWGEYQPLTEEQKKLLELVPLSISPTGRPIAAVPGPDTGIDFGKEADNGGN